MYFFIIFYASITLISGQGLLLSKKSTCKERGKRKLIASVSPNFAVSRLFFIKNVFDRKQNNKQIGHVDVHKNSNGPWRWKIEKKLV
jgi:hypothetical protein